MSIWEYAQKSLALQQEFRASNRALSFLLEFGRSAAFMALVLAVADLISFASPAPTPGRRLVLIGGWALLMAGVDAVRRQFAAPHLST